MIRISPWVQIQNYFHIAQLFLYKMLFQNFYSLQKTFYLSIHDTLIYLNCGINTHIETWCINASQCHPISSQYPQCQGWFTPTVCKNKTQLPAPVGPMYTELFPISILVSCNQTNLCTSQSMSTYHITDIIEEVFNNNYDK